MSLQASVHDAFGPGSRLSALVEEFHPRQGQIDMAMAIARTVENGGVLVVEAGTGVGKTFSYLIPALLSGERVLLSTATKTLQDQLFGRDLPLLVKALGLPVRTALLKGRGSYLCLHRLDMARHDAALPGPVALRTLASVETWSHTTHTGDLAELAGLDERSPVIPFVTSTRENCLGSPCPRFRACHVNLARREALAADVVVINHHLFFADMAVRESGMAELLPTVNTVIFDEAHQLNEIGVQFLGQFLTTGQLLDLARDMLAAGLSLARGLLDWQHVVSELELASRDLRMLIGKVAPGTKLRWTALAPDGVHEQVWADALNVLHQACHQAHVALNTVSEIAPDFPRLAERVAAMSDKIETFRRPCDPAAVRWLDVGTQLRLVESPLDIATAVQEKLLKKGQPGHKDTTEQDDDHGQNLGGGKGDGDGAKSKSWIFTSATLGDDPTLKWFTEPCGLQGAEILRVGSPFDYPAQAAVYVPRDLPKPGDPAHSAAVAALVARAAAVIGGRTLVLTTSLRALRTISEALQLHFAEGVQSPWPLEILVQGQRPKRELMERFRQGANDSDRDVAGNTRKGQPGCILVASASFWEGVDVPGDALQMVVIDKLPFPPPNDPLVEARSSRLEQLGRSPFKDYFLPEAAVALKQGAGRLIRRESDRGILLICDTRLVAMGYGRRLMAALPPMRKISSEEDFQQALGQLTKTSTTGPTCL